MKKKILATIVKSVMTLSVLAGCCGFVSAAEESENISDVTEAPESLYIGYTCGSLGDEYLKETGDFLEALCTEYGYEFTSMGADGSGATQAMQIENMITMGCDVICICPIDTAAIEEAMIAARQADVMVIYCGTPEDFSSEGCYDATINCDQYDYGYKAAQECSAWIDETFPDAEDGSIEIGVFLNSTNELFQKRGDGFLAIEELNPKITIVETYDMIGQDNPAAKAQEYADTLFTAHPNCKAVLAFSSVIGTSIDEVALRTDSIDPAKFGIFSSDWLDAGADCIEASADNSSTFRCLISCADLGKEFFYVAIGQDVPDETGFVALPLTTVTVENVAEEKTFHE